VNQNSKAFGYSRLELEYSKLAHRRGAIIKKITHIERPEKTHFLFEDADFSVATIKKLIRQGEVDHSSVAQVYIGCTNN
jgi:NTE family protein